MKEILRNICVVCNYYAKKKIIVYPFCFLCTFCFLFFLSPILSPFYITQGGDSSVFQLMGLAILNGKIPYRDLLDHKGPVLYFIEAFGQWILPGKNGLFILQVLSLFICTLLWCEIGKRFISPLKSLFLIPLLLFSYWLVSQGEIGNFTEDWNILFVTISFYCIIRLWCDTLIWKQKCILYCIVGMCLACGFFIRPNDAVAFIGGPIIGLYFFLFRYKNYSEIIKSIGLIIISFVIITSPILYYFGIHDAIPNLWYGLIKYNCLYSTGLISMIKDCFSLEKYIYLPIIITTSVLVCNRDKGLFFLVLPTFILGYILLGNRCYPHYFIIWIPIIYFLYWLFLMHQKSKSIVILSLLILFMMPYFDHNNIFKMPLRLYKEIKWLHKITPENNDYYQRANKLFDVLPETERSQIWNYNLSWGMYGNECINSFCILWECKIIPCNRIPMVFLADVDTSLYKDMDVIKSNPKYILFSQKDRKPYTYTQKDSVFIQEHYQKIASCCKPDLILYERKRQGHSNPSYKNITMP